MGSVVDAKDEDLAGIAAKALKETRYHVRHAADWVVRLGDGTEESHTRAQRKRRSMISGATRANCSRPMTSNVRS